MSLISDSITLAHIDTSQHFWKAFDNAETEISALWIVRLCQERGSWSKFTHADIEACLRRKYPNGRFYFNDLLHARADGPWITNDGQGNYQVSDDFIYRCYKASPAKKD